MFGLSVVGQVLIDAALLGLLIFIVARHDAAKDLFDRITAVSVVAMGGAMMGALWGDRLGWWLLAPEAVLTGALLWRPLEIGLVRSAIITALFLGIKTALHLAMAYVMSGV